MKNTFLLWICVVLMRFVKGVHDESSQKSGKEARGLLVDSLGAAACDVQTLFRPCFVIYSYFMRPPTRFLLFFA